MNASDEEKAAWRDSYYHTKGQLDAAAGREAKDPFTGILDTFTVDSDYREAAQEKYREGYNSVAESDD